MLIRRRVSWLSIPLLVTPMWACGASSQAAPAPATPAGTPSEPSIAAPATPPAPESGDSSEATGAPAATENQPAIAADNPSSAGSLSDGETRTMKVIQQTVLEHRERFRACYDSAQANVPELQGDLTLYFVLDSEGKVKEAALNEERSTLTHEDVVRCAIQEIRKLQFPASSKGLETKVNYPFNFNPR